ncbi:disease resistance protein RPV1-like [Eucalyptus grandis]|uniref:disease resistance protein RPV1-like n=1 Tax=Eucalyptus grandis TaxID=71139 RepID=UPI00192ED7C5|nr:disease resistance protein RPV1-like [Eucalyptus grandis]
MEPPQLALSGSIAYSPSPFSKAKRNRPERPKHSAVGKRCIFAVSFFKSQKKRPKHGATSVSAVRKRCIIAISFFKRQEIAPNVQPAHSPRHGKSLGLRGTWTANNSASFEQAWESVLSVVNPRSKAGNRQISQQWWIALFVHFFGIRVFRDDDELRVGEKIGTELIRSITQSKISIPIISENYASSKWCLRELALMLNCKRNKEQKVLPIFYKVKPWQVEHLIGRFGDAIRTHKSDVEEKIVKEWEEALKEVTSLKGLESEKIDNGNEATLVETVVKSIVRELKRLFLLDLPEHLVGIDDQLRHIMSFIDAKFSDTRIIGIYGMGGIGKTTLAMALYNELSSHYEKRSFVLNIQETSKGKGIEHLQKKLFRDIMKGLWDVDDVNEGIRILESRSISEKVLILLDDVDDNTHLKVLIGDKSWFKAGSIVIITTRNKSILDKASADYVHLLEGLPLDPSLILFSRHAFRKDSPPSDYEMISRALVSTTKGLPLAIVVIASLLSDKRMEKWENTLKELQEMPAKEVQKRLMISYEALDDREKHIFLDIACFFIGESQQNPTYMWNACGFLPLSGIEELSHRSLIEIDKDGTFMMHDQLRDLGREIVRRQGLTAPQNCSRLWSEEAKFVLDGNIVSIFSTCLNQ